MQPNESPPARIRAYLQKVATGPELSKSLTRAEAADAMRMVLAGEIDPMQAGIYLIALRMKRESDDENLGSLDALLEARARQRVDCERLIDIADPFNGYARSLPATPFLPPLLAACGLPAYSHGCRAVGPKYGVTHHLVLAAAGIATDLSPAQAAARIARDDIGWAYLDQASYLPRLHDLIELRARMVKRCCLTTLEVVLGPLRARRTDLLTGYVHKAYPPVYSQLARAAGYDGAIIARGVEGGCVPSLCQPSRFFRYDGADGDDAKVRVTPQDVGVEQDERAIPMPPELARATPLPVEMEAYHNCAADGIVAPIALREAAAQCAELGLAALSGADGGGGAAGAMRDSLIYAAAIALQHSERAADFADGAAQARSALDSGAALARFEAARGASVDSAT